MPSFIEVLRHSRTTRTAVLHEFWINYDTAHTRAHAFFEGREDEIFYRPFVEPLVTGRLFFYRCGGKPEAYEVLKSIVARQPACRRVVFFVDKDLSDILQEQWPTDARMFVTDVYSIENYVVSRETLSRLLSDFLHVRGTSFDAGIVLAKFDSELLVFYRHVKLLMAWIIALRRRGLKPNLGNISLRELFGFSPDLSFVRTRNKKRLSYLNSVAGVPTSQGLWKDIRQALKEISDLSPKHVVRGKFATWFLVEFTKHVSASLKKLADEVGGSVSLNPPVEHSNLIALLAGKLVIPDDVDRFLRSHLP